MWWCTCTAEHVFLTVACPKCNQYLKDLQLRTHFKFGFILMYIEQFTVRNTKLCDNNEDQKDWLRMPIAYTLSHHIIHIFRMLQNYNHIPLLSIQNFDCHSPKCFQFSLKSCIVTITQNMHIFHMIPHHNFLSLPRIGCFEFQTHIKSLQFSSWN